LSKSDVESKTPTGFVKCPVCGEVVKAKGKYGHFSRMHKDLDYDEYKDKFEIVAPPEEEEGGVEGLYKGEPDVNSILRRILETHPDVPRKVVGEIMSWAEMSPGGLHPTQVAYLLSNMKGISAQTANIVAQKYSLALIKAQQEGRIPQIPMIPGLTPQGVTPQTMTPAFPSYVNVTPQWQSYQYGWPYRSPYTTSPQAVQQPSPVPTVTMPQLPQKSPTDERLEKLEKMVSDLQNSLRNLSRQTPQAVGTQFEEIREYVDAQGRLCPPNKAVSMRVRRVPIGVRQESLLDQLVKLKQAGLILSPSDLVSAKPSLSEDDIRKIVRESLPSPESLTPEKVEQIVKRVMSEEKEKLTPEKIREIIRNEVRIPPTGVTSPEGVLATAIHEVGRKEPIKVIIEGAKEIFGTARGVGTKPTGGKAGEEERGGIIRELSKHGLVARVIQRRS